MKLLFLFSMISTLYFISNSFYFMDLTNFLLVTLGLLSSFYVCMYSKNGKDSIPIKITVFVLVIGFPVKYIVLNALRNISFFDSYFLNLINSPFHNVQAWDSVSATWIMLFVAILIRKTFVARPKKDPPHFSFQEGKVNLWLTVLFISMIFFGIAEVFLGIGVLGLKTEYSWGVAGFFLYMRIIAIPLILYGLLDLAIKNGNFHYQKIVLAQLAIIGLSQMFISSSRGILLTIFLPVGFIYYLNGRLNKKKTIFLGTAFIFFSVLLYPIVTASRYYRYQYGATNLVDSLDSIGDTINSEKYRDIIYTALIRFIPGYDSLLYSTGVNQNNNFSDILNIISGNVADYFTFKVQGHDIEDIHHYSSPGLIGGFYSLNGIISVIIGTLIFYFLWFSVLEFIRTKTFVSGSAFYSYLLSVYFSFTSEGYIDLKYYIKFFPIYFVVFFLTEKILNNSTIKLNHEVGENQLIE
jgi:hypothetical protein